MGRQQAHQDIESGGDTPAARLSVLDAMSFLDRAALVDEPSSYDFPFLALRIKE